MTSAQDQLYAAVFAPKAGDDFQLASVCEELTVTNDKINKICSEVKTGQAKINYNRQRAGAQYSQTIDERSKAESDQSRAVPAQKKRFMDLKSNLSTAVYA